MGSFTFTHETPLLVVKRTIPFSLAFTLTGQLPAGRVRLVHLRTHQGDVQKTMIGELAVSANGNYVVELSGKGGRHRAPQFAPVVLGKAAGGADQCTIGYRAGQLHVLSSGAGSSGTYGTEIHPADGTEIEVVFGIEDGMELQPPLGMTLGGDFVQDGGHTVDPQVGPAPPVNPPAPPPPQPPAPPAGPANPPAPPPTSPAATDEQAARQKLILAAEEYAAHKAGLDPFTAGLLELFLARLVK